MELMTRNEILNAMKARPARHLREFERVNVPADENTSRLNSFDKESLDTTVVEVSPTAEKYFNLEALNSQDTATIGSQVINKIQLDMSEYISAVVDDSEGAVSNAICEIESQVGFKVIPLKIVPGAKFIKNLAKHSIIIYKGEQYASSKEISDCKIKSCAQMIKADLNSKSTSKRKISTTFDYEHVVYDTLALNFDEMCAVCAIFKQFNARIEVDCCGDVYIVAGDTTC